MRELARDEGISECTVHRIVKMKLGMSYKIQKAQQLTDSMRTAGLERCSALPKRIGSAHHRRILFTDESAFTIEQFVNHQNDIILGKDIEEANQNGRVAQTSGYPKSVMVLAGITADGKAPLIFVENGIKINSQNYLEDILKKVILPWASLHFRNGNWTY